MSDFNQDSTFVYGNPKNFIEVLDELELFIDKRVIFDEKKISVGPPSADAVCQQIL
jgi:hypothetical protein